LKKKTKTANIIIAIVMWILVLILLIPVFLIVWNSLKNKQEANLMNFALPSKLMFENYKIVWEKSNMLRAFFNSLLIATVPTVVSTISASMAAFVLSRHRTKVNKIIYAAFLLGLVLPIQMLAIMRILKTLDIMGGYLGIILVYSALTIPLAVFLYYSFITNIPRSLDEAAIIDGASGFRMFFDIIFPLLKPVTITVFVINFMNAWNDFVTPLYLLSDSKKWGMVMQVYNYYGMYQSNWNYVCTVIAQALLPIVILYIFGQRYIISGMTEGSVKG